MTVAKRKKIFQITLFVSFLLNFLQLFPYLEIKKSGS